MDTWIYCDNNSAYHAGANQGKGATLYLRSTHPNLKGAYSHVFSAANIAVLLMEESVSGDHIARLQQFAHQHLPTNDILVAETDISYHDLYSLACRRANATTVLRDLLTALDMNAAMVLHNGEPALLVPDLAQLTHLHSCERQLPPHIWFHGSREEHPIIEFSHGHYPAHAGFAGLGTVEVSRHAFFFSSDPRMSEEFGHVHPYLVEPQKILNITADLSEEDAEQIRLAGLSPESIDGMHDKWELFDGEPGQQFCDMIKSLGYDAVRYYEPDHSGTPRECLAALTSTIIQPATVNPELLQRRVLGLEIFDTWKATYCRLQHTLSREQLAMQLRDIGHSQIHASPAFYQQMEQLFRDHNAPDVLTNIHAALSQDARVPDSPALPSTPKTSLRNTISPGSRPVA